MDFINYYDEILLPFLEMIADMYHYGDISYQDSLRIGATMCSMKCIEDIHCDMLDEALYNFELVLQEKG